MMKKIAMWAFIVFVIFFVVTSPTVAANVTKGIGTVLLGAAEGFGEFFTRLFSSGASIRAMYSVAGIGER